jgi:hypothetical protein
MPQSSQILGVNSVTNIEPGKGVLPAPIVRNADWFEKNYRSLPPTARYARSREASGRPCKHGVQTLFLTITG